MRSDVAHRRWWQIFEVVFGVPLLAAVVLQLVSPLSLSLGAFAPARVPVGIALAVAGAALVVLARREFARHGQPTDPGYSTSRLVTAGVFSISRNPLYLGGISVLAGVALAIDIPWLLLLLIPAFVGCHVILVSPEERYLAATFGDEYRRYAARVRRWIGRS